MARDYKHSGRKRRRKPTPGWVWMVGGLTIGLFVALLVYLGKQPPVAGPKPTVTVEKPRKDAREVREDEAETIPPPPAPRFDFYTLLPEIEVVIPDGDYSVREQGAAPVAIPDPSGSYVLQAGSFKRFEEADRMKASLALLGVQSSIQRVDVNNETWHRIRIGPYSDRERLESVRSRLRENSIETIVVRAK
jgi:cell division protein FtsN